jgi:uncharacterized membrane protein
VLEGIAVGDPDVLYGLPGMDATTFGLVTNAARIAASKAFQVVYLVSVAFGLAATLASLLVTNDRMDSMLTSHVARRIRGVRSSNTASI